jgi:hypothetical protein
VLRKILSEISLSAALCLAERLLERFLFPGLHLVPERIAATDPTRADSLEAMVAEALGLLALIWLFNGSLYTIGWLANRPLRPLVPLAVTLIILVLTFAGSYAQWVTLPATPQR